MLHCPNKNLKAWKDLVSSVGENKAQLLWNEYEGNVPDNFYSQSKPKETIKELTPESDLDARLKSLMEELGYKVEEVNEMIKVGSTGKTAFGLADNLNKLIQVVNNNMRGADVLPEEVAHIITRLIRNTPIYKEMYSQVVNSEEYKKVLEDYKGVYETEKQFREEAIGKIITKHLLGKTSTELNIDNESLLSRIVKFLKELFKGVKPLNIDETSFSNVASDILRLADGKDVSTISLDDMLNNVNNPYEIDDVLYAINKDDESVEDLKNKFLEDNSSMIGDSITQGVTIKGKQIFNSTKDIIDSFVGNVLGDKFVELKDQTELKKSNFFVKEIVKELSKQVLKGNKTYSSAYTKAVNIVKDNNPGIDINPIVDKFPFEKVFKSLIKSQKNVDDDILDIDEEATIENNKIIYNPESETFSIIDKFVTFSDGTVGIYMFNTFSPSFQRGSWVNEPTDLTAQTHNKEMGFIKETLHKHYGVKDTRISRSVPIVVKSNIRLDKRTNKLTVKKSGGISTYLKNEDRTKLIGVNYNPLLEEKTDNYRINEYLTKLFEAKKLLEKRIESMPYEERAFLMSKLQALNKAINKIQLEKNAGDVLNILTASSKLVSLNKLSNRQLTAYQELVGAMKSLSFYFTDYLVNEVENEGLKEEIAESNNYITGRVDTLERELNEILYKKLDVNSDMFEEDSLTGSKKLKSSVKANAFTSLNSSSNPIFGALSKVVSKANIAIISKSENFFDKHKKLVSNFLKAASSLGYNGVDAYKLLLNKKGNFISERNQQFYKDRQSALENKDFSWFREVYDIDTVQMKVDREASLKNLPPEVIASAKQAIAMKAAKQSEDIKSGKIYTDPSYRKYLKDKKLEKYKSEEFKKIEGNKDLLAFYNFYVESIEYAQDKIGKGKLGRNFVANFFKDTGEALATMGEGGRDVLLSTGILGTQTKVLQYDTLKGTIDDDGNQVDKIPVIGLSPIEMDLTKEEKDEVLKNVLKRVGKEDPKFNYILRAEEKKARLQKGIKYRSNDLGSSLYRFMESIYRYEEMLKVEDQYIILRNALENQDKKHTDTYGNSVYDKVTNFLKVSKSTKEDIEYFDKIAKAIIYGQKIQGKDKVIGGRSVSKSIAALSKAQTLQALGFDPLTAISNLVGAKSNAVVVGDEKIFYTNEQYSKNFGVVSKLVSSKDKNSLDAKILKHYIFKARGNSNDNINALKANFISRNVTSETTLKGMNFGDDIIDNVVLLSVMDNWVVDSDGALRSKGALTTGKIKDPNSKTVKEYMSLDKDGNFTSGLTKNQEAELYIKYLKAVEKIKGTNSDLSVTSASTNIVYSVIMKFRTWMPGLIRARFDSAHVDKDTGDIDFGRFNVVIDEFVNNGVVHGAGKLASLAADAITFGLYRSEPNKESVKAFIDKFLKENPEFLKPYKEGKLTDKDFIELHKAKTNALVKELRIYLLLLALYGITSALGWEDEDDEYSIVTNPLHKVIGRSRKELAFFFDPSTVTDVLKNPTSMVMLFNNSYNLVANTLDEGSEFFISTPDKQDQANIGHYSVKMIPGLNGFSKLFRDVIHINLSGDGYTKSKSSKDTKTWLEEYLEE